MDYHFVSIKRKKTVTTIQEEENIATQGKKYKVIKGMKLLGSANYHNGRCHNILVLKITYWFTLTFPDTVTNFFLPLF